MEDYLSFSVPQLKKILQENGVDIPPRSKKSQLTKLYKKHLLPSTASALGSDRPSRLGRPRRVIQQNAVSSRPTFDQAALAADSLMSLVPVPVTDNFDSSPNIVPQTRIQNDIPIGSERNTQDVDLASILRELQTVKDQLIAVNANAQHSCAITGSGHYRSSSGITPALVPNLLLTCGPGGPSVNYSSPTATTMNTHGMSALQSQQTATHFMPHLPTGAMTLPSGTSVCPTERMTQFGVSPNEVNKTFVPVSSALRAKIIAGKDVSLSLLLSPDDISERIVQTDGDTYILRPNHDPRTSVSLEIREFILAFNRYTSVMCQVFPHRRQELDAYLAEIVEQSARYGGEQYYEYHKAFSAKAAWYLEQGIKLDWSQRDMHLYQSVHTGSRTNTYALCSSISHFTKFCPKQLTNAGSRHIATKSSANNRGLTSQTTDIRGRKRVLHQGGEICNNFNNAGCTRESCNYQHVCITCKGSHSQTKCDQNKQDKKQ
jgi:hypothetical protein